MCEYINGTIIQEDFTMEKTIYNESNGLWYELQGDYYIPCLTVPAEEEKPIGIWGQRHLRYIKQERKALYTELLTEQMAEREGVTEQLKAQDQMQWVQRMNNIRDRATEIVNHDLIYI